MFVNLDEGRNIAKMWYYRTFDANPYVFGEKDFDKEDFRSIIEKTYLFFKGVKESLNTPWDEKNAEENKKNVQSMFEILFYIGEYVAEQPMEDESEDKIFTASCLIARALMLFAKHDINEYYDGGEEPLLYYHPEWWKYTIMSKTSEAYRVYTYDFRNGDMSDMLTLAKYINS